MHYTEELRQAAKAYIQPNGLRPALKIFPCARNGKLPAIKKTLGGNGCKDATNDLKTIEKWWMQNPGANIGLATGEDNGLVVIDIDVGENKCGEESLRRLEQEYGALPQETWEAITPSGGRHLFFKYPERRNISSKASRIPFRDGTFALNIDFRGNGGYVVVSPSYIDGRQYQWEASSYPHETALAELPEAWAELLENCSARDVVQEQKERFTLPEQVNSGTRNETIFSFATSMRATGAEFDEILAAALTVNKIRCNPPLSEAEVISICESASKYEKGSPRKERPQILTMSALEAYLQETGISIRYNVISKSVEIKGVSNEFNPETLGNDLHIILHDTLKQRFRCNKDLVADLLGVIASKSRYNPVTDLLEKTEWDGKVRMMQLYEILNIPPSDKLSRTLISKWCCQCVSLLYNQIDNGFGADGLLVLQGPQGIGKTSFVRTMGMKPEFTKLGQYIDTKDKDTIRRCTSAWIVELGEVETTLRADLERLKAFITAERDEYRLPYGRADQVQARRTSLIATCNSERFLIDPTGSRRFWTVPVSYIDLDGLAQFDALQLWAEVKTWTDKNPQYFRLTKEEQADLAVRNMIHEKPLKSQLEVEDILFEAGDNPVGYTWRYDTVSAFKEANDILRPYSVENIGKALSKLGIEAERRKVDGSTRSVRRLPFKRFGYIAAGE